MVSVRGKRISGASGIRVQMVELSKAARLRLQWFAFYEEHGRNARLTCRHFGITPQTFYRWKQRYCARDLSTLESRSSRPLHVRRPTWSRELAQRVQALREEYPRWGKDKLQVLLARAGVRVSVSMVGRILRQLKARGDLVEALPAAKRRSRYRPRQFARRKPWDYAPQAPGDLVQVDTREFQPLPGKKLKQFTARDMVSRWDVVSVHERATATAATMFLDELQARMPFPVRAIQVDGGSEFKAVFETTCARRGIQLYVLPPRSPKLNGQVERANRCHSEEFFQCYELPWSVAELNRELLDWECVYNTVRPHQALAYRTPQEYVDQWRAHPRRTKEVSPT